MKTTHFLLLATLFVAVALFVLSSCGTLGDDSSSSQNNGACIVYNTTYTDDGHTGNLCFETSPQSFNEERCKSEGAEWISKCPYNDDNDLKCNYTYEDKYTYAFFSGAMSNGSMCSDFDMHSDRKGACQMYNRQSGLTLCMQSTYGSSAGLTEEECEEAGMRWISKCQENNYALKCSNYPVNAFVYGNLSSGATCYALLGAGWTTANL